MTMPVAGLRQCVFWEIKLMSQADNNARSVVEEIKASAKDVASNAKGAAEEVLDSAKNTAHKAASAAQDVAADVKDAAQDAYRSTRRTASEAIDEAGRNLRDAESEYNRQLIDDLATRAQDLAERSINFWADNSHKARRQFQTAADATTRYVSEQPGRSMLIAAATGAAIATAFMLGRSRRK